MAQDWDIKPRGSECYACRTPFADGQAYWAALFRGEEGYVRADRCECCWEREEREPGASVPYSSWQGVFRMPPPPDAEPLRKETAETLLRRLMEDEERDQTNVIYILAVMLERKRTLVERDVRVDDDGAVTRVYEHRKTGETFLVPDPQLQLDQLEHVQQQVVELLGGPNEKGSGEKPPPPATAGAEPAEAGPDETAADPAWDEG